MTQGTNIHADMNWKCVHKTFVVEGELISHFPEVIIMTTRGKLEGLSKIIEARQNLMSDSLLVGLQYR